MITQTKEGIWVVAGDSHLGQWVAHAGRLDIASGEIDLFARYIPKGGVVVDAGACIGDHTATYAKLVGPEGTVLAFEPNPEACACLGRNFTGQGNVVVRNAALGEYLGEGGFHPETNIGASYLSLSGVVRTRVLPLDSLNLHRLDFIHLDVEGYELNVLMGAKETIKRCRPVMVLEINHRCLARYDLKESDVLAWLEENGYKWEEIEKHHGPSSPQRDILCIPR